RAGRRGTAPRRGAPGRRDPPSGRRGLRGVVPTEVDQPVPRPYLPATLPLSPFAPASGRLPARRDRFDRLRPRRRNGAHVPKADGPVIILVVDDEESIRNALRKFLTQQGYEVLTAGTGEEALDGLRRHKVTCMLLDVNLPGLSGIELVPQIMELEPHLALLMLTAVNDATSAALCMQRGAMDYLTKPIDIAHLGRAIQRALGQRKTRLESQQLNKWLKEEVAVRTAEVQFERQNLERISLATLEALVNALEAKDPYLRGHSARVADMSAMVAAEMGRSDEEVELVRTGGRLHDIGKIGIREEVLGKQGPLTDPEYEHVKQHVIVGSHILSPLAHLAKVISFVRSHHERWDGKGYPD